MEQSAPISPTLAAALGHHRAGRLVEARAGYLEILKAQPDEPDVLHLLGLIARQSGQLDEAIELMSRAIRVKPDFAEAHNNLGVALRLSGRLEKSLAAFERAIRIQSDFPEAYNNLGQGLIEARRLDEAIAACREAIRLRPQYGEAHNNLGNALADKGILDAAVAAYRRAIELNPSHTEAHNNLGNALREIGMIDESMAAHRRALQLRPDYAEAHNNVGNALRAKGQMDDAIAAYRQAIGLKPRYAEAHHNLAVALGEIGRHEAALEAAAQAIRLKPDLAEAHNNLGKVLRELGRVDEAIECFARALNLSPDNANAHNNMAVALKDQGRLDEALAHCDGALANKPNAAFHSNKIYLLHFHPAFESAAIEREQAAWDRLHAEPLRQNILPHENDRQPNRRLRIGYIAPYFRKHVVGFNILPLLREHDHKSFEVFCYSDAAQEDSLTAQCRDGADCWRGIVGVPDERVAGMIREDRIDILVDLSQHLSGNRLLVLARKPAPVQVNFAGYPGGTGLRTIDYRLTDPHLDPPQDSPSNPFERLVRLESFWCYDPNAMSLGMDAMPDPGPAPVIRAGKITFGCLNNFCKINDSVLELWALVLKAVPDSALLMLAPEGRTRDRVKSRLAGHGVEAQHVKFVSHQVRTNYFRLYHRIDIGLDTFPYGGHTTSLDSLWMGVPVVTLAGNSAVGRAGVSQLSNLGLTNLIAHSPEEFVRIAVELAGDVDRLMQLRSELRGRMLRAPLTDAARFARAIESAYRSMWKAYCAGEISGPGSS